MKSDFSFFDQPEILQSIFFPRKDFINPDSSEGQTYFIQVEDKIKISCRYWVEGKDSPSILYFHGNGETTGDYESIAKLYKKIGINLFVADFRGYGLSNGEPTFSSMIKDAHIIFREFKTIIKEGGYKENIFLMGRSLGSISAIELAYHYQESICGLIIESGFSGCSLIPRFQTMNNDFNLREKNGILGGRKIQSIRIPTLIIHAEYDSILPVIEGIDLYKNSGAEDKDILIIPKADHNNLMLVGQEIYFKKIEEFIKISNIT
ncbi:MAG: alpha/beta hydrolase [Spirochaetota bacterium]|nr:alpha/beta hydrolase [Spirochaetota bacterium]